MNYDNSATSARLIVSSRIPSFSHKPNLSQSFLYSCPKRILWRPYRCVHSFELQNHSLLDGHLHTQICVNLETRIHLQDIVRADIIVDVRRVHVGLKNQHRSVHVNVVRDRKRSSIAVNRSPPRLHGLPPVRSFKISTI